MTFKRRLLQTSVLSAAVFTTAVAGARADDLVVDSPPVYEVNGPESYGTVWVGSNNPSQRLAVNPGGTLGSDTAALGVSAASDGNAATVTGTWTNTGNFTLGYEGASNTLSISGAGEVTTGSLWLGGFSGATSNQATVDGAAAKLSTTGGLVIGYGSNGNSVTTKNGATVTTNTNLDVGFNGDSNTLSIESGASVISGDDMRIGTKAGSDSNTVTVTGSGSTLTVNSAKTLYVGLSGDDNALVVEDQGKLYTRNARIGGGSDSEQVTSGNTATVNGDGSRWELTGTLRIGDGRLLNTSSDNGLYVEDGATVELMDKSKSTFIGLIPGDTGNTLKVSGTGSSFAAGDISVGIAASNSLLEASDGGSITGRDIGVGGTSTLRVGEGSSVSGRDLSMFDGTTLSVDISDTDPVSIAFTGTAALNGTLEADVVSADLAPGRYDVVTATIVSGTFDQFVVTGIMNNFTAALGYDATAAYILFNAELGLGADLNQNQSNVATALDEYYNGGGALTGPIAGLYDLTGDQLATALTEVSGEVGATGGVNAIERATTSFLKLLLGGGGQSAAPFSARQQAAATINTGVVPTADAPPASGGWSLWGGVYGGAANLPGSASKGSHDTDTNVGGIAAGWDYNVADETRVGIAIAGGQTNWDLDSNLGSGDSTFFQLGAYGTQHFGATYLSLAAAYAWHSMSTERRVGIDGTEKLDADFDASNLAGRIEAGHRFATGEQLGLTPYAALQAQAVYMPGYDENGGSFALDYNANTATALRTELGVGIDTALGADPSVARVFGRGAWAHDWNSDAKVQASFASLDMSTFTVNGAEAPDNIALVTAGAEFGLTDATVLAATFDGEFADGYQSYAGSLTLTYSW